MANLPPRPVFTNLDNVLDSGSRPHFNSLQGKQQVSRSDFHPYSRPAKTPDGSSIIPPWRVRRGICPSQMTAFPGASITSWRAQQCNYHQNRVGRDMPIPNYPPAGWTQPSPSGFPMRSPALNTNAYGSEALPSSGRGRGAYGDSPFAYQAALPMRQEQFRSYHPPSWSGQNNVSSLMTNSIHPTNVATCPHHLAGWNTEMGPRSVPLASTPFQRRGSMVRSDLTSRSVSPMSLSSARMAPEQIVVNVNRSSIDRRVCDPMNLDQSRSGTATPSSRSSLDHTGVLGQHGHPIVAPNTPIRRSPFPSVSRCPTNFSMNDQHLLRNLNSAASQLYANGSPNYTSFQRPDETTSAINLTMEDYQAQQMAAIHHDSVSVVHGDNQPEIPAIALSPNPDTTLFVTCGTETRKLLIKSDALSIFKVFERLADSNRHYLHIDLCRVLIDPTKETLPPYFEPEPHLAAFQTLLDVIHNPKMDVRGIFTPNKLCQLGHLNNPSVAGVGSGPGLGINEPWADWLRAHMKKFVEHVRRLCALGESKSTFLWLAGPSFKHSWDKDMKDKALEKALEACRAFRWAKEFRELVASTAYLCAVDPDSKETGETVLVRPDGAKLEESICGRDVVGESISQEKSSSITGR